MNPVKPQSILPGRSLVRKAVPTVLSLLLCAAGMAEAANFRYYRFHPTKLRGNGIALQFSEFKVYKAGAELAWPAGTVASKFGGAATDGAGGAEGPPQTIDNNLGSKWFNGGDAGVISALVVDTGAAGLDIDAYTYGTGNDAPERDPVSWTLEGSSDNATWVALDVRQNLTITQNRGALVTPAFVIPAAPSPYFSAFSLAPAVVKNGASTTLGYTSMHATTVTLAPSVGQPTPVGTATLTFVPPANVDTSYTLTASSAAIADTSVQPFTVRSVAGGTEAFQYVRFTPLKSGGNIQIADLDFYNGPTKLTAVSATFYGAGVETGNEGPNKLVDQNPNTKWFNGDLVPVVIDLGLDGTGQPKTFSSYSFTIGGDTSGYPGRNPSRWRMEGSSSPTGPWTLIDSLNTFDVAMSTTGGTVVEYPLPGASSAFLSPSLTSYRGEYDPAFGYSLYYGAVGAGRITLQAGSGTETELSQEDTFVDVAPTGPTLYTLRIYSRDNDPAKTIVKSLTLDAPTTTLPATINYPNGFAKAGDVDFSFKNSARLVNDPAIALPGDITRLRIVPDVGSVTGAAWFRNRVGVSGGFDTTFNVQLSTPTRGYGAEGIAFSLQNTPDGETGGLNELPTAEPEQGPLTYALTVELSSWHNAAVAPDTLNEARLRVYKGTAGTRTEIAVYNLNGNATIAPTLPKNGFVTATGNYTSTNVPYRIRVTYAAGKLNVYFSDIQVITDLAVDLADVVDAQGKSWAGFLSRNGGVTENADVTSWVFTSGSVVAPPAELKITSSSFNFTTSQLTVTFDSVSGKTYTVTESPTLGAPWTATGTPVTASGASTTITVPFTKSSKSFFRVETP